MAEPIRTCTRCGVHENIGDVRRLALLLDGRLSVERRLCLRCLDLVLAAVTDACRKVTV